MDGHDGARDHRPHMTRHSSGARDHSFGARDHSFGARDHSSGARNLSSGARNLSSGARDHIACAQPSSPGRPCPDVSLCKTEDVEDNDSQMDLLDMECENVQLSDLEVMSVANSDDEDGCKTEDGLKQEVALVDDLKDVEPRKPMPPAAISYATYDRYKRIIHRQPRVRLPRLHPNLTSRLVCRVNVVKLSPRTRDRTPHAHSTAEAGTRRSPRRRTDSVSPLEKESSPGSGTGGLLSGRPSRGRTRGSDGMFIERERHRGRPSRGMSLTGGRKYMSVDRMAATLRLATLEDESLCSTRPLTKSPRRSKPSSEETSRSGEALAKEASPKPSVKEVSHSGKPSAKETLHSGKQSAKETLHSGKPSAKETLHSGKPSAKETSHSGKTSVKETLHSGKPSAKETSHSGKLSAKETSNSGKPSAKETLHSGKPSAKETSHSGKSSSKETSHSDKPSAKETSNSGKPSAKEVLHSSKPVAEDAEHTIDLVDAELPNDAEPTAKEDSLSIKSESDVEELTQSGEPASEEQLPSSEAKAGELLISGKPTAKEASNSTKSEAEQPSCSGSSVNNNLEDISYCKYCNGPLNDWNFCRPCGVCFMPKSFVPKPDKKSTAGRATQPKQVKQPRTTTKVHKSPKITVTKDYQTRQRSSGEPRTRKRIRNDLYLYEDDLNDSDYRPDSDDIDAEENTMATKRRYKTVAKGAVHAGKTIGEPVSDSSAHDSPTVTGTIVISAESSPVLIKSDSPSEATASRPDNSLITTNNLTAATGTRPSITVGASLEQVEAGVGKGPGIDITPASVPAAESPVVSPASLVTNLLVPHSVALPQLDTDRTLSVKSGGSVLTPAVVNATPIMSTSVSKPAMKMILCKSAPDQGVDVPAQLVTVQQVKSRVPCLSCNLTFMHQRDRDSHFRLEHGEKRMPMHCKQCNRGYFELQVLLKHIRLKHSTIKPEEAVSVRIWRPDTC